MQRPTISNEDLTGSHDVAVLSIEFGKREALRTVVIAAAIFLVLGTASALWPNPLFMRMTPTAGFEIALLVAQSALAGLYLGVGAPPCAAKVAGTGGVLGFLGIACPVCNKLLVLSFGPALLLEYFEPIRLYVGVAGVGLLGYALWRKLFRRTCASASVEA